MKKIQIGIRFPEDVKRFIDQEAARNCSSANSEVIRAIRERMDRSRIESRRMLRLSDEGKVLAKRMAIALLDAGLDLEDNEAGGTCHALLLSQGFEADLIDSLWNRIRFEFYELMENVIDTDDADASSHRRWPEFAEYVA